MGANLSLSWGCLQLKGSMRVILQKLVMQEFSLLEWCMQAIGPEARFFFSNCLLMASSHQCHRYKSITD